MVITMKYEILNDLGEVINTIVADAAFVEKHHPGKHRLISSEEDVASVVEPEPVPAPTKEELLDQLEALQAQITALGE